MGATTEVAQYLLAIVPLLGVAGAVWLFAKVKGSSTRLIHGSNDAMMADLEAMEMREEWDA